MENEKCTLVSAFCDIQQYQKTTRPRDNKVFLKESKHILALEVPMILFIEPTLVEYIREERSKSCSNPKYVEMTKIIPFKLEESPYYAHRDIMETVFEDKHPKWKWPSFLFKRKDTPCYEILMWSKTHFLETSISQNPFSTDKFCWVDLGIFYIDGIQNDISQSQSQLLDIINTSPRKTITCLAIHGIHPNEVKNRSAFYRVWNARTAGGLICGGTEPLTKFISLFKTEITFCVKNGCFVPDEPVFSVIRAKNRELYTPFYGDYQDIFSGYRIYTLKSHMGKGLPLYQLRKCVEAGNHEDILVIGSQLLEILSTFTKEEKKFIIQTIRASCSALNNEKIEPILLEKEFEMFKGEGQSVNKEWWMEMKEAIKHKTQGNTSEYVACCEKAWKIDTFSVEPILHICEYHLKEKRYDKVHHWAQKAVSCGHRNPEIDKVLMMVSYNLGYMAEGLRACDSLVFERDYPIDYKSQGKMALFAYVQKLPHLLHLNLEELLDIPYISDFDGITKYNPLNPSIVPSKTENGFYINCRLVNYHQDTNTGMYTIYDKLRIIRTRNMLLEVNEDLEVISQKEIHDRFEDLERNSRITVGLEDMRLFWQGDDLCFSATTLEGDPTSCPTIAMGQIKLSEECVIEKYVCMEKPTPGRQEKNWIPVPGQSSTSAIYMFDPFTVLDCDMDTGKTAETFKQFQKYNLGDLRGSSGVIPYQDGYLTITHQITIYHNRRYYFHRFVYFEVCEGRYTIHSITYPFYFLEKEIEFCSGLCENPKRDTFLITFGLKDREAHLIEVDKNVVKDLLFEL